MWLSRLWFLVALLAAAVAVGAALTLPGARDADVAAARDRLAQAEARYLTTQVGGDLRDQQRSAELLARDPRIQGALDQLQPEMPPHIRRALVDKVLQAVAAEFPRTDLALVGADGVPVGATLVDPGLLDELAKDPRLAEARQKKEARLGPVKGAGGAARWLVAVPVPRKDEATAPVLAVVGGPPETLLANALATARSDAKLVIFNGDHALPGSLAEADAIGKALPPIVGSLPPPEKPTEVQVGGQPFLARRFALAGVPQTTFALVWAADPPTTLARVGGVGALPGRFEAGRTESLVALGAAAGAWIVGVLLLGLGLRRSAKRLAEALDGLSAVNGQVESVKPGLVPAWAKPALEAACNAAEALLRKAAPRNEAPAAVVSAPAAAKKAEAPAGTASAGKAAALPGEAAPSPARASSLPREAEPAADEADSLSGGAKPSSVEASSPPDEAEASSDEASALPGEPEASSVEASALPGESGDARPSAAEAPEAPAIEPEASSDEPGLPADAPAAPAGGPEDPAAPADTAAAPAGKPLPPPGKVEAPADKSAAPAAKSEAPASKAEGPAGKHAAPAARSEAPASKAEGPAGKSVAPAAKSEAPATTAEAPAGKSVAPAAKSEAPAGKADSPTAKAEAPAGKAESLAGKAESPAGKLAPAPPKAESPAGKAESPAGKAESPAGKAESPAGKAESPAGKLAPAPAKAESPAGKVQSPAGKPTPAGKAAAAPDHAGGALAASASGAGTGPAGGDASDAGLMPEISLPALEDDDGIEPEEQTDGEIRLPARAAPPPIPPAAGGSLLERLRSQGALEPREEDDEPESPGDRTAVRPVPLELLAASRRDEEEEADATQVVGLVEPPPGSALDLYLREVFETFYKSKQKCGESVDGLDYPRFRRKLLRTRNDLLSRFDCRDVRFRVYVKDGKTALKAAPVLADE
jgi:hypothetical protein